MVSQFTTPRDQAEQSQLQRLACKLDGDLHNICLSCGGHIDEHITWHKESHPPTQLLIGLELIECLQWDKMSLTVHLQR